MTGFSLPVTAFRKLNVWLGVWEKFPSNKLCMSWRRCIYSSHQSSIINYRKHFSISPVKHDVFLRLPSQCISVPCVRLKSDKSSRKKKQTLQEEEEDEEEEDEEERSDSEDEFENDPNIVKGYKDLAKVVQSFRYDIIIKCGLDIARNKVEDAFYNGELRLNGEKLWKKSRTVKVGDTLDLIVGEDKETETAVVMRVVLKKASEKTESEKYKVVLRRWKSLKVPKQDVFK
ncbi:mitochondrial transcription rescue factor 1 [Malaclemys terrapin pileata]|uniref:mitochondrial transcription rescue factor 1 n=1 Tax=Malaclemys terrapin pileata TaxID=2991368 RepID=UPI0023A83FF2|nr:mitochondrial transcription rescue factor 1 [Malaclemys terrapin pileata]XP_053879128.1 mitochondrial transcription rescue factor 1 [Malaclemys terrapin pileata]